MFIKTVFFMFKEYKIAHFLGVLLSLYSFTENRIRIMTLKNTIALVFLVTSIMYSCGNKPANNQSASDTSAYVLKSPNFDADSAYNYVAKQVEFGFRIPNSPEHTSCGDYLVAELKRFGADVTEQKMIVTTYNGVKLNARNIIGSYGLDKSDRILLFAHWDTRPFSDQDSNPDNHNKPVLGANDAASGVGVLLEIARVIQQQSPTMGIDIIFFDAEDYGPASFATNVPEGMWWCLGSQYWSKNPHIQDYRARFGILLDMVGAPNATFYKEGYSNKYAGNVVGKIWGTASQLGYESHFPNKMGGYITDDHVPIIENMGIPCVDIIQYDNNTESGFGHYWHTVNDDMTNISKETLKAVGQTVLEVIYKEEK